MFGIFERGSKKVKIISVQDRSANTLQKLIKDNIEPGTTIYSDCWRSYHSLNEQGYDHHMVNHSENFVNPVNGVHTQHIERLWKDLKSWILRSGIKKTRYSKYIARYLHSRTYKGNSGFHHILLHISSMYKHPNSP